jgi:hypothetical protein
MPHSAKVAARWTSSRASLFAWAVSAAALSVDVGLGAGACRMSDGDVHGEAVARAGVVEDDRVRDVVRLTAGGKEGLVPGGVGGLQAGP